MVLTTVIILGDNGYVLGQCIATGKGVCEWKSFKRLIYNNLDPIILTHMQNTLKLILSSIDVLLYLLKHCKYVNTFNYILENYVRR